MNHELATATTSTAEAVAALAEAAQRALSGRVLWTPVDATAAVRTELLPLWPEASPAAVRDALACAARLAVASGISRAPESVAIWACDALLSAEYRSRDLEPLPGFMSTLDAASLIAFRPEGGDEALQILAVVLALAHAPGAPFWHHP